MLVFIDESGDTGLDVGAGASSRFAIGLVVFEDDDEALACDRRIELLRHEIKWRPDSEFHFIRNSNKAREAFFVAVAPYNFFYYGIVIRKRNFTEKDSSRRAHSTNTCPV